MLPRVIHVLVTIRTACVFLTFAMVSIGIAQRSEFHIYKGDEKIGNIHVDRREQGDLVRYHMDSYSEFSVLWTQEIRTSVVTEYFNGKISYCHSSFKVNDSIRDSSYMKLVGAGADCYVHPDRASDCKSGDDLTTARMYFEEPINASMIYVESVLTDCPLVRSGPGNYVLTFPNDTQNTYSYRNGVLHEILVVRPLFDLVF